MSHKTAETVINKFLNTTKSDRDELVRSTGEMHLAKNQGFQRFSSGSLFSVADLILTLFAIEKGETVFNFLKKQSCQKNN